MHFSLPFSDNLFFIYMLATLVFLGLGRMLFLNAKRNLFPYFIFLVNSFYFLVLFPKPIQLIGFVLLTYIFFILFGRKLKIKGVFIPMILLSLPLIAMKFTNILSVDFKGFSILSNVFQITGLSFATFRIIQVYIDEKDTEAKISFIQYFNFVVFLPTFLIGPLDKFDRFNKNVENGFQNISLDGFVISLDLLLKGLVFKFILAESIQWLILDHLVNDGSIIYHLGYMYSYLIYLFFDFAGYSLLAMSFGKMLGINVPYNFNRPFSVTNIKEFWQHWHKSLGDWLNDYFFKPIFKFITQKGYFKPIIRQNIALFLTFALMGFWNGFELHFIISGLVFGLYAVIHNYYSYLCKKNKVDVVFKNLNPTWVKYLSIFITFNAVAFAIYIFSGKLF